MQADLTRSTDRAGVARACIDGLLGSINTALVYIEDGRTDVGVPLLRVATERAKIVSHQLDAGYMADVARIQKVSHDQA